MARLIANNFSTTLNGAITAIATSMTLTSVTGFPAVGGGDTCQVTLDDGAGNIEIVTATAIAGSVITITRAQEGTTGFAFADLDPVEIRDTALLYTDVLASDETPALIGPLDASASGAYVGFGGSSSATAYCLNHSGNVPVLRGAANYWYTFTSSSCDYQAGTSFYKVQLHNSNGFSVTTNNVVRIQANNSGVQFGATGARITSIIDDDTMATASAVTLATSESIKAYADSVGGGAPEGTAVLSTGEVGGTKYLREDGDGTCSWQAVSGGGDVVDDTTPQLGGDLDVNGNQIVSVSAGDIELHSDNDVNIILGDAAGVDDFNIKDSASAIVASINSDGDADFTSLTLDTALPIAEGGTSVTAIPVMQAARGSNQTISTATFTKAQLNTENLDSNGDYDNATNYRFTPTIAGVYLVVCSMVYDTMGDQSVIIGSIYKNGSASTYNACGASGTGQNGTTIVNALDMNGSTDYIELYVYQASGVDRPLNTNTTMTCALIGQP
jgi:hypothetical protein